PHTLYSYFYHDTAILPISTLSLHDALPIYRFKQTRSFRDGKPWLLRFFDRIEFYPVSAHELLEQREGFIAGRHEPLTLLEQLVRDRKSTRLNSSHVAISYAVFCLKKKN